MKRTIQWATGLFEGEGSINQDGTRWQLQIGMTDKDVLEDFANYFDLNINGPYVFKPGSKPMWKVKSNKKSKVRSILLEMLPHLGMRRAHKALDALDDLEFSKI